MGRAETGLLAVQGLTDVDEVLAKIGVFVCQGCDADAGMHDRGVVLAAQGQTGRLQGEMDVLAEQVHGDLPGEGSLFVTPPAFEDFDFDIEVGAHGVDYLLLGHLPPGRSSRGVCQNPLNQVERD